MIHREKEMITKIEKEFITKNEGLQNKIHDLEDNNNKLTEKIITS